MSEKILVPVLGESITEATVSKWLKNEGDSVEADEPLVELETDKVNLEVPSPVSGVLTKINSKNGSVVEVGADLGSVSESETKSKENQEIKKIQPTVKVDKENLIDEDDKDEEMEVFQDNVEEEKPLILTKEVEPLKVEAEIKRARNDKGQLVGDDPDTPDVNEAWEGGKAPKKKGKKK